MKRSEAINEIVKKSYDARYKALKEAAKDDKITGPSVPAAPAAAAASAPATAGAGASSSGGSSTRSGVPVLTLRKLPSKLLRKDKVFILPSKKSRGDLSDIIALVANSKKSADEAIVHDLDLIEGPEKPVEKVPIREIEYEVDPFEKGDEMEEAILIKPISDGDDFYDIVLSDRPLKLEQVYECKEGDAICKEEFESYDLYEVEIDNPSLPEDFKLLKSNNEEVMADGIPAIMK